MKKAFLVLLSFWVAALWASPQKGGILMVIAQEGFRDEELEIPKALFEEKGFKVEVAARTTAEAKGMLGLKVKPDLALGEVDLAKYKAVVFVGGVGAQDYFSDPQALGLAREAYRQGKVLGAICLAPVILARAGVLEGKRATVWPSEAEALRKAKALHTGRDVEVDGRVVTAKGPHAARAFAEKILELLGSTP